MQRFGFLFLILMTGCGAPAKPETILLGHLAPTDQADAELRGIALAVEELNAAPEKRPLSRRILALHAEVSANDADFESQSVRLGVVNRVSGLIGGITSARATRINRADQSEQYPAFVLAGWSPPPFNPALFHLGVAPRDLATALARYAKQEWTPKRLILLVDQRDPIFGEFAIAWRKESASSMPVALQELAYNSTTPRTELAKSIHDFRPDLIAIAGRTSDLTEILHESHQAGVGKNIPVVMMGEESEVVALSQLAEGTPVITASSFAVDLEREKLQGFVKVYREKYGTAPNAMAALAYEATLLWSEAVHRSQGTESRKIRDDLLKNSGLEVLTGKISFTKDLLARRPIQILRVAAGTSHCVRTFDTLE